MYCLLNDLLISHHKCVECDVVWFSGYADFIHHLVGAGDGPGLLSFVVTSLADITARGRKTMGWESALATAVSYTHLTLPTKRIV